jgi:hypothetical protein
MLKSFLSLRKFFNRSIITDTPFDERLWHHEVAKATKIGELRGHRISKMVSSFVLFVCFVVISIFLLVAAPPRQASMVPTLSN